MRLIVLILGTCLTCAGFTAVLSITPTATQAVVTVVTDQPGPCTYRASENANFNPLVHDVDPMLFTGSDSDARAGSMVRGSQHTFVLGQRTAQAASDGLRYSRALQANTMHWIGVTCGSDPEAIQSFQTQNPPLGQSAPEEPPFSNSAFGNYAWPSIDWKNANDTYIDPLTGVLIKRITSPGWRGKNYQNNAFGSTVDVNGTWTNASNAAHWPGTAGTLAAYAGSSSDPLFLAADLTAIPDYTFGALQVSGWKPYTSIDDVMVRTYGYGDNGSAVNRTVLACLSNDSGNTCATDEVSIVLPSSAGTGPTAPSTYPQAALTSWGNAGNLNGHDWGTVVTTVTTSGTTITDAGAQSAQYFSRSWGAGCKVLVNGSEVYTIASVDNGSQITTVEMMTAHSMGVSFKSLCSGVRVRKQTATGTIYLDAGYDVAFSVEFQMPFAGARNLCSPVAVTVSVNADGSAADPRSARLCVAQRSDNNHVLFAFFADNGETRLLSTFESTAGYQYHDPDWKIFDGNNPNNTGYSSGNVWDPNIATRFYGFMNYGSPLHTTLIQIDYTGDFREYRPGWYVAGPWPDDRLTYKGLNWASNNAALDQLVAAAGNPNYDSSKYINHNFAGLTDNGKAIWQFVEQQDDPAITVLQNITDGTVTSVTDDITAYPRRFFGNHGPVPVAGNLILVANILGNKGVGTDRYLGGPFVVVPTQINRGGTWSTDTSLAADYEDTCPAGIDGQWQTLGATGNNCILMRAKQPCSANAGASELAKYPCAWDAAKSMIATLAPGDRFWVEATCNGGCSGSPETMRVVSVPTSTGLPGEVEFWALRGSERFANLGGAYDGSGNPGHSPSAHANSWTAVMIPPEARTVSTVWMNGDGVSFADTYQLGSTHFDVGQGYSGTSNYTTVGTGSDIFNYGIRWDKSIAAQAGQTQDYESGDRGVFHHQVAGGGSMESYISMRQIKAPANEKRWFLDLRHMSPFSGSGQEVFAAVGTISASLVTGTSGVFKFSGYPGDHNDIKLAPAFGYAGRYLLQDISSSATGNQLTDATPYSYCVVYKASECRGGSAIGEVYASVPHADAAGVANNTCIGGWYATTNPCIFTPFPMHAWGVQVDASRKPADDNYWRKLTMGFSGPGRQYQFGTFIPTPDGTWAFMQGYWLDGKRNEILGVKLPPFPVSDTLNHADFIPVPVAIGPGPGVAARVRFGYAENGPVSSYFCTSRLESCVTDTMVSPFAYAQSDALMPTPCLAGCFLSIPAISGRVVYYKVERLDESGQIVGPDTPLTGAIAVP